MAAQAAQPALVAGAENSTRSYTWFIRATVDGNMVDRSTNSTFKALLDSRKDSQEKWLGVAETISFSCSDLSGTGPPTFTVEGIVHG